jgi:serine phosphatase RsbU (regulator of sigma subunit)
VVVQPPPEAAARPDPHGPMSITDFLTDGSLAGLCAELANLSGATIELQDAAGHAISQVLREGEAPAWTRSAAPSPTIAGEGLLRVPIDVEGTTIGAIALGAGGAVRSRARLERTVRLVAQTTAEICKHDLGTRLRMREIDALSRLSALVGRGSDVRKVLDSAIDLALDVLGLDAGSVMLFKELPDGGLSENEEDLAVAVSRGLSESWLAYPTPLSKDRLFDKLAIAGEVVSSEDVTKDDRVMIPQRAAEEGLGAALHAGLIFKKKCLGVVRLYSRGPRVFREAEKKLLAAFAGQVASSLEQSRLLKLEEEERRMQAQLALAGDVQRRMLPRKMPDFPKLEVAARYIPSFELGGDFYDFLDLSGHLGVALGDVVGKGVPAALLMSAVRASLRAFAQDLFDLDEIVRRVNQALCRDTRENEFASLWYGVIDPQHLRLTYCSAGHEPPIVLRVPKGRRATVSDLTELSVGGMVVGLDAAQRYQRAVFDLKPGDVLLAYTDGVTDAADFGGRRFGKQRLREAVVATFAEKPHASAGDLLERVLWEVRQFAGLSTTRMDDRTLVALRVR